MNIKLLIIAIIILVTVISCSKNVDHLTPIRYDYDHLKLTLNSSLSDSINDLWRWDYMTSNNSIPDTIGVDHFMNISQETFSYDGQETQPFLGVTTFNNRITEFSATIIFKLFKNIAKHSKMQQKHSKT